MAKESFGFYGFTIGELRIEPQQIVGGGGPEFPRIFANIEILMPPFEPAIAADQYQPGLLVHHTLIQLSCILSFNGRHGQPIEIAEFSSLPLLHRSEKRSSAHRMSIPIDLARLTRIEEQRTGDVILTFDLTALIAKHPAKAIGNSVSGIDESIEVLRTAQLRLTVQIPQSHWVYSVLPGLGYGKLKIVEVPTPDRVIPEVFAEAIKEFEKAEQYMKQSDFDNAVSQCRKTLDLIPNVVRLTFEANARPSYPDRVKQLLKDHLPVPLGNSKREAIEHMITTLWKLTSITHHQNSQTSGYFGRADADLVMLMTTALLSYVGRLLSTD
jgi:hypothetical protein